MIPDDNNLPPFWCDEKKYQFSQNWNITYAQNWIDHLQEWEGHQGPISYLEVGIYEGRSGCWMLDNVLTHPQSRYTGMDIWVDPKTRDRAYRNLSRHEPKVRIIEGDSRRQLRKLPVNGFDVVYVDACHLREHVFFDTVLAWDLSRDLIIWDDYRNPNFSHFGVEDAVDSILENIRSEFRVLFRSRQICISKKREIKIL
jgi:predicted O-methyltransferase YrrM